MILLVLTGVQVVSPCSSSLPELTRTDDERACTAAANPARQHRKGYFIASNRRQTPGWTPGFTPYKHALMQHNMPCRSSGTEVVGTICCYGWCSYGK